jgi:hypothetical protein
MKTISIVALAGLFCVVVSAAADAKKVTWVSAKGQRCDTACERNDMTAVTSGEYTNGESFFVCRTNAHGEGNRPGYNLGPSWDNICVVGWGGREEGLTPYSCLCR